MRVFLSLTLLTGLAAALPKPDKPSLDTCTKNPVLSILSALKASPFCTSYLGISTVTVVPTITVSTGVTAITTSTSTLVDPQTALSTNVALELTTSVQSVPGKLITTTLPTTIPTTSTFTSTTTTTRATTVSTTTYIHNGGIAKRAVSVPAALKNFASSVVTTACQCYVTTPTTTIPTTKTDTSTSVSVLVALETTSPIVTTQIQSTTTTSTVLTTTTGLDTLVTSFSTTMPLVVTSTTSTSTSVSTVRPVVQKSLTFVQSFSSHCVPYNYLGLFDSVPVTTYHDLFEWCADKCASTACSGIYIADHTETDSWWCMTNGIPTQPNTNFDFTWTAGEFQCNYPPIGKNGEWYSYAG